MAVPSFLVIKALTCKVYCGAAIILASSLSSCSTGDAMEDQRAKPDKSNVELLLVEKGRYGRFPNKAQFDDDGIKNKLVPKTLAIEEVVVGAGGAFLAVVVLDAKQSRMGILDAFSLWSCCVRKAEELEGR